MLAMAMPTFSPKPCGWLNLIKKSFDSQSQNFFTDIEEADQGLHKLWAWKYDIHRQYADKIPQGLVTTEMNEKKKKKEIFDSA